LQLVTDTLAKAELEKNAQSLQAAVPTTDLYLPISHSSQIPPLGPVKPALHLQSLIELLPASELDPAEHKVQLAEASGAYFPAPQVKQEATLNAGWMFEYVPALQSTQRAAPVPDCTAPSAYLPAPHKTQLSASTTPWPAENVPFGQSRQAA